MRVIQSQQQYKTDRTPEQYLSNDVPYQAFRSHNDLSKNIAFASRAISETLEAAEKRELEKQKELKKIKEQQEKDKILELTNQYTAFELPLLYDQNTGYYTTTGKNALDNYENVWQQLNEKAVSIVDNSELSQEGVKKLNDVLQGKLFNTYQALNTHAAKERVVYRNELYSESLDNTFKKGVHNRYDDNALAVNLQDVYNLASMFRQAQNLDDAAYQKYLNENKEKFHSGVLAQYVADGDRTATEKGFAYLKTYKNDLSPATYSKFYDSLKDSEFNYVAQKNADYLLTLDEDKAYSEIDTLRSKNVELGNKTQQEYERKKSRIKEQRDALDKQTLNEFAQNIYDVVADGTPEQARYFMQNVMNSDISFEAKEKARKFYEEALKVDGLFTNVAHKQYLEDMACYHADEFKNINLLEYKLNKDDYEHFAKKQREIGSEAYTQEADFKKAVDKIAVNFPFFANFGDRLKNPFIADMVGLLSEIERKQGKAFSFGVNKNGDITGSDKKIIEHYIEIFGYKKENVTDKNIDEIWELYNKSKAREDFNNNYLAGEITEFQRKNKRLPSGDELYEIMHKSYETYLAKKRKDEEKNYIKGYSLYDDVVKTTPKYGETKVLTYFADTRIKQLEDELGFKLTCVEGSRFRKINPKRTYISPHYKGDKLDVSVSEHSVINRIKLAEALLADPLVKQLNTSDDAVLARFKGHPKLKSMKNWDKGTGKQNKINHSNHFDIELNTRFGGSEQYQLPKEQQIKELSARLKQMGFSTEQINQWIKARGYA